MFCSKIITVSSATKRVLQQRHERFKDSVARTEDCAWHVQVQGEHMKCRTS